MDMRKVIFVILLLGVAAVMEQLIISGAIAEQPEIDFGITSEQEPTQNLKGTSNIYIKDRGYKKGYQPDYMIDYGPHRYRRSRSGFSLVNPALELDTTDDEPLDFITR